MSGRGERLPVPAGLRPWVDRIEVMTYAAGDRCPLIHLPDPATVLLWRVGIGGRGDLLAAGPRTRAAYYDAKDVPVCVRLRIRPGHAPSVLGIPAGEIADRIVPLGELWGRPGDRLVGDIADRACDPAFVAGRVGAALAARAGRHAERERARAELVRAAAAALSPGPAGPAGPAALGVAAAARRVGVSERRLREVFTAAIGLPPKRFARLARVRTVVGGLRGRPLAHLAGDAGYYDQSHMTAEFRQIMRVTPAAFTAGRFPAVPC